MKINYYSFYFLCIWASFCHGKNVNVKKPNSDMMEKAVKTILGSKTLIISRAVFAREDYPMCVVSRLKSVSTSGYQHNLSYYEKEIKMPTQLGKRVYLDAHYTVHRKDKVVVFVVHANIGNALEQPKLSGSYITLYANKGCFIVGTESPGYTSNVVSNTLNSPKANTACLVWRLLKANEEDRARCRATFAKVCGQYGRYKFVFTKDVCLMKQSINQTLPATKQMN
ncbi:uncharacterized protein [Dermacentor andersoni]|uniref:uncharacterized protein isoform X2 n=1 Tax=Dermacentor andersoni TaxID=34620 RepID=UPI003B3ABA04